MLRLQLNQKTAVSVGYSSGMMGRGHRIFMPQAYSNNTYGTVYSFSTSGDEVHRLPVLLHHEVKRFNFTPINPEQTLYNYSVGLSVYGGGGLNYRRQINDGTAVSSISFMADTITEVQRARLVNKVGAFVTGGVTARFYRLGKEKLNLTLFLNQGLTDMLKVDLDYRYNRGHGTEQFRVRGSSVGLMLGVPIRLKTFEPTPPPGTR
ncbi:hypothetical protein [Hymenobacter latericus]|uniref:hypothetical protein n=1 Tax=Hymenobacter sp. YIM 151858-1 TaxID=2987688 RepID=UPI002225E689|nr:hypothetical protein [Hymenobacter sp. YIM 151858-1]UYZ58573.1 hypothetical protein OIS50_16115 [Hymenobacter sp. YIM 151858-1]